MNDMIEFETVEFTFKFPNFSTISVQLLAGAGPILIDLVNN